MIRKKASKPTSTPKPLVGAAAVKEYQRQVSPAGVAAAEARARAAVDKRYGSKTPIKYKPLGSVAKITNKIKNLGK